MSESPTPAFKGSLLGPQLCVLSRPQIRNAKQLTEPTRFDTRDGIVNGRPGDIAITAYGKEQYPITHDVFLGAYEILGQVGNELIAERLIHVRRAWEVLGDGGTYDYGPVRGTVSVEHGSWLYQSDDNDFGIIHPSVKDQGHLFVGIVDSTDRTDWCKRTERLSFLLCALPPVLILLALSAWVMSMQPKAPTWLSSLLTGVEVLLLLVGAAAVSRMKLQRWFLRACVEKAINLGQEFESAVALLGHSPSKFFPGMTLWRAAQSQTPDVGTTEARANDHHLMQSLHSALVSRLRLLDNEIHHVHRREALASWVTLAAFVLVLVANVSLLMGAHGTGAEVLVIWIPALVSALHAFDLRRRTAERVTAMKVLADRLRYAQSRLRSDGEVPGPSRDAVLRVICRATAQFSQRELKLAVAADAPLPL